MVYFVGNIRFVNPQRKDGTIIAKFEELGVRQSHFSTENEAIIQELREHKWNGRYYQEMTALPEIHGKKGKAVVGVRTSVNTQPIKQEVEIDVKPIERKPVAPKKKKKEKQN